MASAGSVEIGPAYAANQGGRALNQPGWTFSYESLMAIVYNCPAVMTDSRRSAGLRLYSCAGTSVESFIFDLWLLHP